MARKRSGKVWAGGSVYSHRAQKSAFGHQIRFVTVHQDDHFRIRIEKNLGQTEYILYQRKYIQKFGRMRALDWEQVGEPFWDLELAKTYLETIRS